MLLEEVETAIVGCSWSLFRFLEVDFWSAMVERSKGGDQFSFVASSHTPSILQPRYVHLHTT